MRQTSTVRSRLALVLGVGLLAFSSGARAENAAATKAGDSPSARERFRTVQMVSEHLTQDLRQAYRTSDSGRAQCLDELLARSHAAERHAQTVYDGLSAGDLGDSSALSLLNDVAIRTLKLEAHAHLCGRDYKSPVASHRTTVRVMAPVLPQVQTSSLVSPADEMGTPELR